MRAVSNFLISILGAAAAGIACGVISPVTAAPRPPAERPMAEILKEADLGLDTPVARAVIVANIAQRKEECDKAIALLQKLIEKYPDHMWLRLRCAYFAMESGGWRRGQPILEAAVRRAEFLGDRNIDLYRLMADVYKYTNNRAREAAVLERMFDLFPHFRSQTSKRLIAAYRAAGDEKKMNEAVARLGTQGKSDLPVSALLDIKPTGTDRLQKGYAYEVVAESHFNPRFRLIINGKMGYVETGTVQYLPLPPDFNRLVVLNPESKNCMKTNVDLIVSKAKLVPGYRPIYSKVTQLDSPVICGQSCVRYKCQFLDDSRYDLVVLNREFAVDPAFSISEDKLGLLPLSKCMVLNMARVENGCVQPIQQVHSIKKVKFDGAVIKEVEHYHEVKRLSDLIFGEQGEMKSEDLDEVIRTK